MRTAALRGALACAAVLTLTCLGAAQATGDGASAGASTSFRNPVIAQNFPDPGILRVGSTYYAYGTESDTANIPVMSSPDLVHWTPRGDALPRTGTWSDPAPPTAAKNEVWAPEVVSTSAGYAMVYAARTADGGQECIGLARATSPAGPFVPGPRLECDTGAGGSIDPSIFRGPGGGLHLLWKNDGNAASTTTVLWTQPLTPALQLTGQRRALLRPDRAWQQGLIEAPEMVFHAGSWWLFYAAAHYASAQYVEGVARCVGPIGPCSDSAHPLIAGDHAASGPGHAFVLTTVHDQTWVAYHAWRPGRIGGRHPGRQLWLSRLRWMRGGPVVERPTRAAQPAPF